MSIGALASALNLASASAGGLAQGVSAMTARTNENGFDATRALKEFRKHYDDEDKIQNLLCLAWDSWTTAHKRAVERSTKTHQARGITTTRAICIALWRDRYGADFFKPPYRDPDYVPQAGTQTKDKRMGYGFPGKRPKNRTPHDSHANRSRLFPARPHSIHAAPFSRIGIMSEYGIRAASDDIPSAVAFHLDWEMFLSRLAPEKRFLLRMLGLGFYRYEVAQMLGWTKSAIQYHCQILRAQWETFKVKGILTDTDLRTMIAR